MKRWLKRFLRPRKANGIPFHLPKRNIREGAHSKWQIFCTIRSTGNNMTFPNQLQYLAHVRHFATTILSWKKHWMDIFCATLDQFELPTSLQLLSQIKRLFDSLSYQAKFHWNSDYHASDMVTKTWFPPHDIRDFRTFLQQQWSQTPTRNWTVTPRLRVESYFQIESSSWRTSCHSSCRSSKTRMQGFSVHNIFSNVQQHMDRPPTIFQVECDTRRGSNKGAETGKTMDSNTIQMGHQLGRQVTTRIQRLLHCWNKFGTVLSSRNMESNAYFLSKKRRRHRTTYAEWWPDWISTRYHNTNYWSSWKSTSTTSTYSITDPRTTTTIPTTDHWTNHTTIPTKTTLWSLQPHFHTSQGSTTTPSRHGMEKCTRQMGRSQTIVESLVQATNQVVQQTEQIVQRQQATKTANNTYRHTNSHRTVAAIAAKKHHHQKQHQQHWTFWNPNCKAANSLQLLHHNHQLHITAYSSQPSTSPTTYTSATCTQHSHTKLTTTARTTTQQLLHYTTQTYSAPTHLPSTPSAPSTTHNGTQPIHRTNTQSALWDTLKQKQFNTHNSQDTAPHRQLDQQYKHGRW